MSGKGYQAAGFMDGFMNGFDFVDRIRRQDEARDEQKRHDYREKELFDLRKQQGMTLEQSQRYNDARVAVVEEDVALKRARRRGLQGWQPPSWSFLDSYPASGLMSDDVFDTPDFEGEGP